MGTDGHYPKTMGTSWSTLFSPGHVYQQSIISFIKNREKIFSTSAGNILY